MIRNLPIAVALAIAAWPGSAEPQEPPTRRVVERAEDLPRHAYPVTTIAALLEDDAQFAALAERVEADLISDLKAYEIADVATLKLYFGILSDLAVQRGEFAAAAAWQDSIRAREQKLSLRQLAGIVERSLASASRGEGADFDAAFRESFRREVSALPFAEVQSELRMMRQGMEFIALPNAAALGRSVIEQLVHGGRLSLEGVQQLVRMRAALDRLLPRREAMVAVLDEVIAANEGVAKPDIWAARDVGLDGRTDLTPVVVAIWDSGVDVDLFPGRLFVNAREAPGNGRDDDGNGYVDDVHGIAYDLNHDRSSGVLGHTTLSAAERSEYARFRKGQADLVAGVESPDAQVFRQKLASMQPAEIRPWLTGLSAYTEYIHGTHVAGIAVRDNPAARLLVARNEEDNWKPVPQVVTLEGERKRAQEYRETVAYLARSGVRVVTMSWSLDPGYYEDILAKNQVGGDADRRRRLARELFDTAAAGLRAALESAPGILFTASAGNEDADNQFATSVPASLDLPNVIIVGAVDHAGDEAPFTNYGKVDVYASGSDVASVVPGGAVVQWSGTSMAAPQVANLAAKLLALNPELSVAELRRAIVEAADEKVIGDRRIRLLNPRAAVDLVTATRDDGQR
jgi:subtilisin family serine protease